MAMTRNQNKSTAEELEEVERNLSALYGASYAFRSKWRPLIERYKRRAKSLRSDYAREGW